MLNDILDAKKDRLHPEKKSRPIASGKFSVLEGEILFAVLLSSSVLVAVQLPGAFVLYVLALFFLTLAYSLWFKREPFVDILIISINFVIRASSGNAAIQIGSISPWLIVGVFFMALFLAVGKRYGDISSKSLYPPEITFP